LSDGTIVQPQQVLGPSRPGRKLAISGDTRPCDALAEACLGADVLVHESTFSDDEQERAVETKHSTAREAGRIARQGQVKRLIITHFSSRHDSDPSTLLTQARAEFNGPVDAAWDGMSIEVPMQSSDLKD
jgi:ribonuclease Z